ncbi:NADPH-dependent FMN reductase [Williamsia sterculiae]|uniref:NAD(P)H-dependent FMN reductase n=1 Tax=Williamsia sterculiae TaxID=1344003 RepID=A0A1N7FQV7_9NOCA|nr:NADPH-dependent FMN reductase [Williamsia sterculiae]SIS02635.1 NAD(P)H-dependent FMN reductase [Williamsia sterculiae]
MTTIVALVGSLRSNLINRQLAEIAREAVAPDVAVEIHDGLAELPFYNEDVDTGDVPAAAVRLRTAVAAADAVLLITPEYNGTIPAVLKNAIDWLSRPYGSGALVDKPIGVIGAALGRHGGKWSQDDTRRAVGIAGGRVVEEVELRLGPTDVATDPRRNATVVDRVEAAVRILLDQTPVRV